MKRILGVSLLIVLSLAVTNTYAGISDMFGIANDAVSLVKSTSNLVTGFTGSKTETVSSNKKEQQDLPTVTRSAEPKQQVEKPHDVIQINADTIRQIEKEYVENRAAAYSKYENKWFKFDGVMARLGSGTVLSDNQWANLSISVDNKEGVPVKNTNTCWGNLNYEFAKGLKTGDKLTVTGKLNYHALAGGISFKHCIVERT